MQTRCPGSQEAAGVTVRGGGLALLRWCRRSCRRSRWRPLCVSSGRGPRAIPSAVLPCEWPWASCPLGSERCPECRVRSALPAHRPWRERGEGHLRHAPRSRWESARSGPCPPRETLQSCRREDRTCCGGGSFSVLNLTTPRVRAPGPPHSGHVLRLLRSVPSFCQSPISDAERLLSSARAMGCPGPRGAGPGPWAPAGSGVRGGCRAALAVCGSARVPRRREPRVVGPVSHPKHLSVTRLLAPPSPVPLA